MSPVTTITNELRMAELSLKDESKVLRMMNAKGNGDRRQFGANACRLSLTPRVLRRTSSAEASQA